MNIHEYQAKELLKKFGVRVQEGIVATTAEAAVAAARQLREQTGTTMWVIKAQIHAGGRGKAGGVKLAKSLDEVAEIARKMLGMRLVTPQTGPEGKVVRKVLVAQDVYYPGPEDPEEYYISIMLDRAQGKNVIVYSPEGGVNIEEVAEKTPDKIFKEYIHPGLGIQPFEARKVAFNLGLSGVAFKHMVRFVTHLYRAYEALDASLVEINPCLKAADGAVLAVDAKINLDDNALFRHPDYKDLIDKDEYDPLEWEAMQHGLNYIRLDGNIGCMVNGAGLAMATMDMIKLSGGEPANFLDVGGAASAKTVEAGFRIILKDPNVKAILVNIFGGIVRCDRIANGIIEALKNIEGFNIPLIVRLQGTNADIAREIIEKSGYPIRFVELLEEAAQAVSDVVKGLG